MGLAVVCGAAWLALLARPPRLEGDDLAEARRLHQEAQAALEEAARLALPPEDSGPPPPRSRPVAWALALGAAFLLASAALWAVAQSATQPAPIHEHARFAVYADGARVDYGSVEFDLSLRGFLRGHLHAPDGETMHLEGAPGLTLGEFFARTLGGAVDAEGVRLDAAAQPARAYSLADARLIVSRGGTAAWTEVASPFSYEPRDGDLLVLVLGATPPSELPDWASGASAVLTR